MGLSQKVKEIIHGLVGGEPEDQKLVVDALERAKTLVAGSNITLTPSGNNVTIAAGSAGLTLSEVAGTPSNPAAGFSKIYIKSSDHKLYRLTSAGVETLIG